ncbi:MAG: NAD(P)-dependent alcohol dehydrogenase [Deltaproteobacteria bacterium]|nr:NAD(P)-dependent alcohol dehydrogenase [Deltaproteobacteria bacterium]
MKVHAYAAPSAGAALEPFEYELGKMGPNDVDIEVTHCGICHSDVHIVDNNWQATTYPSVPGHEVIGKVAAVGDLVTHLQVGQRVGVGWQKSACGHCPECVSGDSNLCSNSQATALGNYGGFADLVRTDARFVFPIPDDLPSEHAAPLLCAGATVYSPLLSHGITGASHVGVIGIGGLGHLALQFYRAWGCEVTAFSTSPDKEAEARQHGAHRFVVSTDPAQLEAAAGSLDLILNTIHHDLNWETYLGTLRTNGRLCFVGVPGEIKIQAFNLLGGQKGMTGSVIGSPATIAEMLEFAARHNIRAQIETYPMGKANEALDHVRSNKARYRVVLER